MLAPSRKSLVGCLLEHGACELLLLLLLAGKLEWESIISIPSEVWTRVLSWEEGERPAAMLLDVQAAAFRPEYWRGVLHDPIAEVLSGALILNRPAAVKHLLAARRDKSLSATNYQVLFQQPIPLLNTGLLEGVLETLAGAGVPNILLPIKDEEHLDVAASIQTEAVAALLQSGAYLKATKGAGPMALMTLLAHGNGQANSVLSARGSSLAAWDERGKVPLVIAAGNGNPRAVDTLLRLGVLIEASNTDLHTAPDLQSALWAACKGPNVDCIELLCSHGATTEAPSFSGETPLMVAGKAGNLRLAVALLKWGACVHAANRNGETPLILTSMHHGNDIQQNRLGIEQNWLGIQRLLLDNGADIHAKSMEGLSALSLAARRDYTLSVGLMLDRGADIDARDKEGLSALAWAAKWSVSKAPKLLLDRGADIHAKDKAGLSALAWAAISGSTETLELLLDRGADIHAKDKKSLSALTWAAIKGSAENVELLLDRGADIHGRDKEGLSALAWAARKCHSRVAQLLLERGADREEMDWEAMKRLHGEDPKSLDEEDHKPLDEEDHKPLDEEDHKKTDLGLSTVCECAGRRFAAAAEKAAAETAAAEAAAAETATAMDEMDELDGTGNLDEMDELGGTGADGL